MTHNRRLKWWLWLRKAQTLPHGWFYSSQSFGTSSHASTRGSWAYCLVIVEPVDLLSLSDWGCMPTSPSDQNGTRIFAYEIESIVIDTFIHVGEMAWKSPYYVRETLIDLAAGHEAHGFALSYFPLPMGGRAVDRSPVSFNGPMCRLLISTSVTWNFIIL